MIRVAVIGAGYWGPNLIRNFRSLPRDGTRGRVRQGPGKA